MNRFPITFLTFIFCVLCICHNSLPAQDAGSDADRELILSIMRGDLEAVQAAIEQGANVNRKGKRGFTPYEAARRTGFAQIADLLVSKGAKTDVKVPTAEQYTERVLSERFTDSTPACVALISRDGKIVMQKAFGRSDIAGEETATIETRFRIGSVTKQFTAAAILKLEEDGLLSVEDKLSKYLPKFPRSDEVTLRHLLTHTSGIANYTDGGFWSSGENAYTEKQLIGRVKNREFEFEPGERYSYCNTGYTMLGLIVGKVTESSLEAYLKKTFFDPLGMKNTGMHRPDLNLKNESNGYSFAEGKYELKNLRDMSWAAGAGAMYSTVGDLHLWNEALFSNRVLKEATLARAFKPTTLPDGSKSDYGFGWMMGTHRGLRKIEHGGGLPGFQAHLVRYPEVNTTIAVLVNALPHGEIPPPATVAKNMADTFLWESMEKREVLVVDKNVDPKTFADFVGEYDYGTSTMEVTAEDGKIFAKITGQSKLQIYPGNANTFFWKVVDAQVEFQRDKDGKVVRAMHTQNGSTFNAPRLPDGFKVSPEVLAKYVGRYDYRSGVMNVTADGSKLFAQITGQQNMRIYPKSETVFEWRVVKAQVEFVAGKDGKIEKVIHTQGGRSFDAAKMDMPDPIKVTTGKLDEYVGSYSFGFLAGNMVISRDGETMYGQLGSQPKLKIVPVAVDEFAWVDLAATMKFVRDEEGNIIRGDFTQAGNTVKAKRAKAKAKDKKP